MTASRDLLVGLLKQYYFCFSLSFLSHLESPVMSPSVLPRGNTQSGRTDELLARVAKEAAASLRSGAPAEHSCASIPESRQKLHTYKCGSPKYNITSRK